MSKETETTTTNKVPFNYFLQLFEMEIGKKKRELCLKKDPNLEYDEVYFAANVILTAEEVLKIYNDSFYEILVDYLVLSKNKSITMRPTNPIVLCGLILNTMEDNPYKESLLRSVQFIIVSYLKLLGKGEPTIYLNNNGEEKKFTITYDSQNRMNQFESSNMSLEEQGETMLTILKLSLEKKEITIPGINTIYRKDI